MAKLDIAHYIPAHPTNYTKGRMNVRPNRVTIHHSAGFEDSLGPLFQNPATDTSSHFYVHPDKIEQYVDTDDTAWTNGSWLSNAHSLTIEVRGDWRNYFDQKTLDKLEVLLRDLYKRFPNLDMDFHNDIVPTICPAELKSKGIAEKIWDKIVDGPDVPPPKPTPPPGQCDYTVVYGDTLSQIAVDNHQTEAQLMEWNPIIKNPDHIEVGWVLRVC